MARASGHREASHPAPVGGFCRDCLEAAAPKAKRCKACGSPRLLAHDELHQLHMAHIDCDAFYASVEKRDNPELASLPVIVGGGTRGVVSTCCYVARIYGVRSAMPMFKALAACPDAVVIKPDMEKYVRVGRQIRTMMQELTPQVEPISIDEAFLDLSGTAKLHKASPAVVLAKFAGKVERELGLSVSVGLSYCKFLAKVASDFEKPRGFSVIGKTEAVAFLRTQPVSLFWGVGRVTQAMLAKDGITEISTVQDMSENELAKRYGSIGMRMAKLAFGEDARSISPGSGAKSVSSETTFNNDISDLNKLAPILRKLSERVSAQLKNKHIAGQTIVLKLKTADFKSRTRNRTLPDPTRLADRIYRNGLEMLEKETDGTRFRLIGIGVSSLMSDETADPHDLVDVASAKRAKAEMAIDNLREKFGTKAIEHGITFDKPKRD
jgi:DNA polymerase-4